MQKETAVRIIAGAPLREDLALRLAQEPGIRVVEEQPSVVLFDARCGWKELDRLLGAGMPGNQATRKSRNQGIRESGNQEIRELTSQFPGPPISPSPNFPVSQPPGSPIPPSPSFPVSRSPSFPTIIVLTAGGRDDFGAGILRNIRVFVRAGGPREDLRAALRAVAAGQPFCSPSLQPAVWRALVDPKSAADESPAARSLAGLTPRQREAVALAATHLHDREIAERMGVSLDTVRSHLAAGCKRLGVSGRFELLRFLEPPQLPPRDGQPRPPGLTDRGPEFS
jgi:DNA-binding NarL/FixJ family response regulator